MPEIIKVWSKPFLTFKSFSESISATNRHSNVSLARDRSAQIEHSCVIGYRCDLHSVQLFTDDDKTISLSVDCDELGCTLSRTATAEDSRIKVAYEPVILEFDGAFRYLFSPREVLEAILGMPIRLLGATDRSWFLHFHGNTLNLSFSSLFESMRSTPVIYYYLDND